MNRDQALAVCSQSYADSWAGLWDYVNRHGVEEAAAMAWHPGHNLTIDQIAARIRRMQRQRKAA